LANGLPPRSARKVCKGLPEKGQRLLLAFDLAQVVSDYRTHPLFECTGKARRKSRRRSLDCLECVREIRDEKVFLVPEIAIDDSFADMCLLGYLIESCFLETLLGEKLPAYPQNPLTPLNLAGGRHEKTSMRTCSNLSVGLHLLILKHSGVKRKRVDWRGKGSADI